MSFGRIDSSAFLAGVRARVCVCEFVRIVANVFLFIYLKKIYSAGTDLETENYV